ncbi:MBL fold metallo-hydrolase [Nocardiopsis baichengensis]|uniref:hypothetical protein n=1 Tax=Nocardiopsis baichengensis TaxID=280240 RepID=UPI000344FB15|nr:hypothetical protein [Nocardiopsis baichengensis]
MGALTAAALPLAPAPAHAATPGTVSPLFGVHHRGRPHTAMLWGGTNPPAEPEHLADYLDSIDRFRTRMHRAGADVELSAHPNDHGLQRMEQIRRDPHGPNPFVLGRARTHRYMAVMDLMIQGRLADARA